MVTQLQLPHSVQIDGQASRRGLIPRMPPGDRLLADVETWLKAEYADQVRATAIRPLGEGVAAGRVGNFINGELWGRLADPTLPWGMVFRGAGDLPRHPSQVYQFLMEGLLLFVLLWLYARTPRLLEAGLLRFKGGCAPIDLGAARDGSETAAREFPRELVRVGLHSADLWWKLPRDDPDLDRSLNDC